jgi:formylglycine-generating enzyme required for sulfatase activity
MKGALRGTLALRHRADGWALEIQPASRRYEAGPHEPIVYEGRPRRARQDWKRLPAGGISFEDAERYLAWLRESGRVPGARFCSELEWERAARGADDRLFPHGDELASDDANFDATYDRTETAYGPDEVGAHPDSRSPFEIDDMAGNVFERVAPEGQAIPVIRGGGYFFSAASARSTNREPFPRSAREVTVGLRVCADLGAK